MKPRATTQSKLEHSIGVLAREFAHLPREQVIREFEAVTQRLLEGARFDDYIPVLAHRFARDQLRETQAHGGLADAA